MEGKRAAEGFHIVIASFAGIVGSMNTDAEVAAQDEHADVEAQAYAGTEGKILEKCRGLESAARSLRVFFQKPHVAGVDKDRSVKRTGNREAVFDIGLELECTCLVEISAVA